MHSGAPLPGSGAEPLPTRRGSRKGAPEPIAALNRVRIAEYELPWERREPLVDIRVCCPAVEVPAGVGICPYLRETVANMVSRAQRLLPAGHRLRVGTALRTLDMQRGGWDHYFRRMQEEHPAWPLSALRRATNRYFAPYDQKAPPGHCTGGAVDVALIGPDGAQLDVTSPTTGWQGAYTWSDLIGPEAKRSRMLMVDAMLEAGFSNCRDEFWHYSWGDSAWAVRVGEQTCPYGWAHPPVAIETDFEGAAATDPSCEIDRDVNGRATSAVAQFGCQPDGRWAAGLYWASGAPVTLRVCGARDPVAYLCLNIKPKEGQPEWVALDDVAAAEDSLLIPITPGADRVWLASAPLEIASGG